MQENNFIDVAALIGEPARAKMLWNLLDGRAYTAGELAVVADVSGTSASNHLTKLLDADLLKVQKQGRHRYFSFSKPEIAYVVESLASLSDHSSKKNITNNTRSGIKYCGTCYDHLAGYVGVKITEALERKRIIKKSGGLYVITTEGWVFLKVFGINKNEIENKRRPLTKQCLDWSERRPHIAGQMGAMILTNMLEKDWFRRVKFSRELVITLKGRKEMGGLLGVEV